MKNSIKYILHHAALASIGFCLMGGFQVAAAQDMDEQVQGQIIANGMMNVVCATCNNPLGYVALNQTSSRFDHTIHSHTLIKDQNIYRCEICKTPLFEASNLVSSQRDQLTFSKPANLLNVKYETYHLDLPPLAGKLCSFCRDSASQNEFYEPGIVLKLR